MYNNQNLGSSKIVKQLLWTRPQSVTTLITSKSVLSLGEYSFWHLSICFYSAIHFIPPILVPESNNDRQLIIRIVFTICICTPNWIPKNAIHPSLDISLCFYTLEIASLSIRHRNTDAWFQILLLSTTKYNKQSLDQN